MREESRTGEAGGERKRMQDFKKEGKRKSKKKIKKRKRGKSFFLLFEFGE